VRARELTALSEEFAAAAIVPTPAQALASSLPYTPVGATLPSHRGLWNAPLAPAKGGGGYEDENEDDGEDANMRRLAAQVRFRCIYGYKKT
jgi:hypothetical protein